MIEILVSDLNLPELKSVIVQWDFICHLPITA